MELHDTSFSILFEKEYNVNLEYLTASGKVDERILRIQVENVDSQKVFLRDILEGEVSGLTSSILTDASKMFLITKEALQNGSKGKDVAAKFQELKDGNLILKISLQIASIVTHNFEIILKHEKLQNEQLQEKHMKLTNRKLRFLEEGPWFYTEQINFNCSVEVSSGELQEVTHYTREFQLPCEMHAIEISLNIPFVGNETNGKRSRIVLFWDDMPICDCTKYNQIQWELHPIAFNAIVTTKLEPNKKHKLSLKCSVDGGRLHIPHYNSSCIEASVTPKLFATLLLKGHRKFSVY